MTEVRLPESVAIFFEKTTRTFSKLYKPSWLLSEVEDNVWVIDLGENVRVVAGSIKGGVRLKWDRSLPGSSFSGEAYRVPLEQAKTIVVWAHDGAMPAIAKTIRNIYIFHLYMMWLIEFLAVRYGERFQREGFSLLTIDDLVEFLEAAVQEGVCGTGAFISRWEKYLSSKLGPDACSLENIKNYLDREGAYDVKGHLDMRFVGEALNIDNRRLRNSSVFKAYIGKYSKTYLPLGTENLDTTMTLPSLATWCVSFCQVLAFLPIESEVELSDSQSVLDAVRPFRVRIDKRTKTLPLSVGRKLTAGCCKWMIDIYPDLFTYIKSVIKHSALLVAGEEMSPFSALSVVSNRVSMPSKLVPLLDVYARWQADTYISKTTIHANLPYPVFLLRLHIAVCFCLIAMLSCCRRTEVIALSSKSIKESEGWFYLTVLLRKTGVGVLRERMDKPVPMIIAECLESLAQLKKAWKKLYLSEDPLLDDQAFFKVNARGMYPLVIQDVYVLLGELSESLDLVDVHGERWVVLPHQLRRYFAMTFFHFGGAENALPALSWFMGHENIEETWHYIKESLTGREISASEAAMATAAVCSADESAGAKALRDIIQKHFGCESLSVMNEDEILDYLEMLAEQGAYTVSPVQVRCGKSQKYTVLISIKDGFDA